MADNELDLLVKSLPHVGETPIDSDVVDTIMVGYIDESLRESNRALYNRIHKTIRHVYNELDSNPNLNSSSDKEGHLIISRDQFHGVIALSVLRGAAEVLLDIAEPLRASRELDDRFLETA